MNKKNVAWQTTWITLLLSMFITFGNTVSFAYEDVFETYSSPQPNVLLATGAATLTIPIKTPKGRGVATPNLNLTYNSYNKQNGMLGIGWSMNMGAIQRNTKHGVCYDCDDYIADGVELVAIDLAAGDFRAKVESAFAKYHFNSSTLGWEVTSREGVTYYYGTTDESRDLTPTTNGARVTAKTDIVVWNLDKVEDTNGNIMEIGYWGNYYSSNWGYSPVLPYQIRYNYDNATDSFYNKINLYYSLLLNGIVQSFQWNFTSYQIYNLRTIEMIAGTEIVGAYDLQYKQSESNSSLLLSSVQQFGSDVEFDNEDYVVWNGRSMAALIDSNKPTSRLPKTIIEWEESVNTSVTVNEYDLGTIDNTGLEWYEKELRDMYGRIGDNDNDGRSEIHLINTATGKRYSYHYSLNNVLSVKEHYKSAYEFDISILKPGDFNNDGRVDFLNIMPYFDNISDQVLSDEKSVFYIIATLEDGNYADLSCPITEVTANEWGSNNNGKLKVYAWPGDINGDGITDLVAFKNNTFFVFYFTISEDKNGELTLSVDAQKKQYTDTELAGFNKDLCWPGDCNGDGKTDLLSYKNEQLTTLFSTGNETFPEFEIVTNENSLGASGIEGQIFPGDYNGDGKLDLARCKSGDYGYSIKVYISVGNGSILVSSNSVSWPLAVDSYRQFRVGDFNGDGRSDLITYLNGKMSVLHRMFNEVSTTDPKYITIDCTIDKFDKYNKIWIGDFNGDGLDDFATLHTKLVGDIKEYHFSTVFIDKLSEKSYVSNVVTSVYNEDRLTASLSYTPSSQYVNKKLPFILQPVESQTIYDGFGNGITTKYSYEGGYFDKQNREFMGFGKVRAYTFDPEKFRSGLKVETLFHVDDEYLKGKQKEVFVWGLENDTLYSQETMNWEKHFLDTERAFVRLKSKENIEYDGDATVETHESYTYYDNHGGVHTITSIGPGPDGDFSMVTEKFYGNYGEWTWRLTGETVSRYGDVIREMTCDYETGTGNMLWKEHWLDGGTNPRTNMTYDNYGNVETITDPRGSTTTTTYDSVTHMYPIQITYPTTTNAITGKKTSHVVYYPEDFYDFRFGKPSKVIDENANPTVYVLDTFGRVERMDSPGGGQVITLYDDVSFPHKVITMINDTGILWTAKANGYQDYLGTGIDSYTYTDDLGKTLQTVSYDKDRKPIVTKMNYDSLGRNNYVEGPFYGTGPEYPATPDEIMYPEQETIFDERGRPIIVSNAIHSQALNADFSTGSKKSAITDYKYAGLETTITDPDRCKKKEKKDFLGRLIEVTEYDEKGEEFITSYTYNIAGDLKEVKDHFGNTTIMTYDTLGRKTTMIDPDMSPDTAIGIWRYTSYDDNGNLLTQIDAENRTVEFRYDEQNRLTRKIHTTTQEPDVIYTYDEGSMNNGTVTNGKGRLYSVSFGTSNDPDHLSVQQTCNAYDSMGNLTRTTKTIGGTSYTTGSTYDTLGRLEKIVYPGDGYSVKYTYYPGCNLLEKILGYRSDGSIEQYYARIADYDITGKIKAVQAGNDTVTSYTYGPYSKRLIGYIHSDADDTTGIEGDFQNKQYTYTLGGDIASIINRKEHNTLSYTYDTLHRLKSETSSESTPTTRMNVLENTYEDGPVHATTMVTLNSNTYSDYAYDNNGNMIRSPELNNPGHTRIIKYNNDNKPVAIYRDDETLTSRLARFWYDPEGSRVKKVERKSDGGSVTESETVYINEYYEIRDNAPVMYVFMGNERLAQVTPLGDDTYTRVYYHKDHLGSTVMLSDGVSDTKVGPVVAYNPFGTEIETPDPTDGKYYRFTDQELDWGTGLYDFHARLYDPVLGMFITADTIVPDYSDPQTLNRYGYCRNNPMVYTDPDGHCFITVGLIIGGLVGAYQGYEMAQDNGANFLETIGYTVAGAYIGAASGATGGAVAGAGYATLGIAGSSAIYSGGMYGLSGGETDFAVSLGAASYNFSQGDWGYLGKSENSGLQNFLYFMGAMANVSDINRAFNSTQATVNTDNSDFISHSSIKNKQTGDCLMSYGPDDNKVPSTKLGFALSIRKSTPDYHLASTLPVDVTVNTHTMSFVHSIAKFLPYQGATINCANMASLSLWVNGIPNIGLQPYILYGTTWAYSSGIRPDIYSYYFNGKKQ